MGGTNSGQLLPPNWGLATIGQLVSSTGIFIDGDWIESKDQDPEGDVRLIQLADIGDGDFKDKSSRFLTKTRAEELGCTFLKMGDVLIARLPDPLGRACIFPFDSKESFVTAVDICIVRIGHDCISNKYLAYLINSPSVRKKIDTYKTGSTRKRISRSNLGRIELPIAPLNEQHRIVAKIEELFSELDKGVESLTTAREQLKVYRQALLKHAFEGKLTEQWRAEHADQLETADQLLARIKKEREKRYQEQLAVWKKGVKDGEKPQNPIKPRNYPRVDENELEKLPAIPDGWRWIKSGNLFMSVTSGSRGWAKYYSDHGAIFVRITNLNFDTLELDLRPEKVQHVKPPERAEGIRTKIQEGDFLFSITGYLGMFAIAPKLEEAYVNQHIALARPVGIFNKEYVGHYFSSRTGGIHQFNKLTKGAVKAGLGLEDINTVSVPMCSVLEQEMIVALIEERLSMIDKLEQDILLNIDRISAMRQSILKKAFSGELVPQDPNDEPASELLARIKAEREDAQQQAKKIPRKAKKKKEVITMADLMEVMQSAKDWMRAQEAFRRCGIADGAETDAIEKIYEELRGYVKENKIAVERRGEEDWLRLAQGA